MASSSVAMRDLEEGCADISIEGEDDGALGVDFFVPDDQADHDHLCVVGRFLTARPIDFEAMRHVMASLWQPGKGVYVKEIDSNRYLFQFYHEIDLERVVEGSPWTFNRQQFVFQRLQRGEDPKKVVINSLDMWVQIHGLQTGFKSASVVERLEGFVGTFIKSNPKNFQHVWREYMRLRVSIDITVPLKRRKKLQRSVDDPSCWAEFKYEYVPTFCVICGVIGHSERFCSKLFEMPIEEIVKPYGSFMRAQPRRRYNLVGSQWLRDGEELYVAFDGRSNSSTVAVGERSSARPITVVVGEDQGIGRMAMRESPDKVSAPINKEQTMGIGGKVGCALNNAQLNMLDEVEDGVESLIVLDTKQHRMLEANVCRTQLDGSNVGRAQVDRSNVVDVDNKGYQVDNAGPSK
ncbi:hypothetical protein G4B88_011066 [Cannabis sativa]|uniref:DUF4283 domain-containing protein n=1 Tax=Cannabis sativa TaxID=3483 RepID=A0A7J6DKU5_CANSA|nr:hypothetical protein G4B88_011066 [Cannabis sativa]